MLLKVADVTVKLAVPVLPLKTAVITDEPASRVVLLPLVPPTLLIVAVAVVAEAQVTLEVISRVVPSE